MSSALSPSIHRFITAGGVEVSCRRQPVAAATELDQLTTALDAQRGLLLSSRYEVPGRYSRHDLGLVNPPLVLEASGSRFQIRALNARGQVLLGACDAALRDCAACRTVERTPTVLHGEVLASAGSFSEEERTRQPSLFSVLRRLCEHFAHPDEPRLGLYGAFGYDLVLQFEPLQLRQPRAASARDLVLYLPDELLVVDHGTGRAERLRYDFQVGDDGTEGLPRDGANEPRPYRPDLQLRASGDHAPGEFEATVREARAAFGRGDLFEVTASQCFTRPCPDPPSRVFTRLQRDNPAPFGLLANLGAGEYLIGASPEMYVRVQGRRVETCPIAGTIARGADAFGDAEQIRTLLASAKDEAELTMCSDVDRNDKARICEPGSVRVLGRRQIELYSRLIHTVDHIEGTLRPAYDALDAFVTHCWAVTVTGAPKPDAMQFIEDHERSPRGFYGGAVGVIGFDGHLNTGLTLRTIHLRDGRAEVRAGATLLFDSVPEAEAAETRLKAAALFAALEPDPAAERVAGPIDVPQPPRTRSAAPRVLLIDHRDSFVHTLGDYFRQAGAEVRTLRTGFDHALLDAYAPALVVLSPGPGRPADFDCARTLAALLARRLPVFGVCLGLQAMAEYFGGELGRLDVPVHGKASRIRLGDSALFEGLPRELGVGRYHSLFARADRLPGCLRATAQTGDGCIMALEHRELPLYGVQFHPESILSAAGRHGPRLVQNALELAVGHRVGRTR